MESNKVPFKNSNFKRLFVLNMAESAETSITPELGKILEVLVLVLEKVPTCPALNNTRSINIWKKQERKKKVKDDVCGYHMQTSYPTLAEYSVNKKISLFCFLLYLNSQCGINKKKEENKKQLVNINSFFKLKTELLLLIF